MNRILRFVEPTYDYNLVNKSSVLLTSESQIQDHVTQYHTSLGDIDSKSVLELAKHFDTIELVADHYNQHSTLFVETMILLRYLSHRMTVTGIQKQPPLDFLSDLDLTRPNHKNVLWVFGCSHTFGTGLDQTNKRFADLIAKQLNMPVEVIAMPGSSLDWSFRHLINAEITPDDTVIWQITTVPRFTKKTTFDNSVAETSLKNSSRTDVFFWTDEQLFFKHLSMINLGIKHLRSIGCKTAMTSLSDFSELDYRLITEYSKYPEYCYMPDSIVDYSNDHVHYGCITHQNIADGLVKHLKLAYA